jgi:hypothetical protein
VKHTHITQDAWTLSSLFPACYSMLPMYFISLHCQNSSHYTDKQSENPPSLPRKIIPSTPNRRPKTISRSGSLLHIARSWTRHRGWPRETEISTIWRESSLQELIFLEHIFRLWNDDYARVSLRACEAMSSFCIDLRCGRLAWGIPSSLLYRYARTILPMGATMTNRFSGQSRCRALMALKAGLLARC